MLFSAGSIIMDVVRDIAEVQRLSKGWRRDCMRVGFVPTMGYLHEGHLSLVRRARADADIVVVSIFVNPTQFCPGEDFESYPRDEAQDAELLEAEGVDVLFMPVAEEMYSPESTVFVEESELSEGLCGAERPGHFRGVLTVVCKLFNLVQPDMAVFGGKDAQQAALIKQMVRDLNIPVMIDVAPIVREGDGLAMSSRNTYLSADERKRALCISAALRDLCERFAEGRCDVNAALCEIRQALVLAGGDVDYVSAVDAVTLKPVELLSEGVLVAVACRFGRTRLIDNVVLGCPGL